MSGLKDKKIFFMDMDGTIYHENDLIDGALDFFEECNKNNIEYVFLTNNSSKNKNTYLEKLHRLDIYCTEDMMYSSVDATVDYLKRFDNPIIYLVGTNDLYEELSKYYNVKTGKYYDRVDIVLIGFDTELNYDKLRCASYHLENGAKYIATNPDYRCPIEDGRYIPDCGTLIYMFKKTTGRVPFVIGKPRSYMVSSILKKKGYKEEEAVIVGDRLYTDIMCGINAGIDTILVLSGEATKDDLAKWKHTPTYIFDSIKDVKDILKR